LKKRASGALQHLHPEVHVDVRLHWHQWKLRSGADSDADVAPTAVSADIAPLAASAADALPTADTPLRAGVLDRVGRALADGARAALRPPG